MLDFYSFGSGSSGNCYLLYADGYGLLLDAGIGIRKLKKEFSDFGLSFSMINAILITHDHADHVKSVGALSSKLLLPVFATELVHRGIVRNYYIKKKIPTDFVHAITVNSSFHLGPFEIEAFHVPHDSSDNVGYTITYKDIHFTLMTDVGQPTEEMKGIVGQSDYIVVEANHDEEMLIAGTYPDNLKQRILSPTGHMSNRTCGQLLADYASERLKHVWLCHLSNENNRPDIARATVERALTDAGIKVGSQLLLDVLDRTLPNGPFTLG